MIAKTTKRDKKRRHWRLKIRAIQILSPSEKRYT
jgi:hypothetical protein